MKAPLIASWIGKQVRVSGKHGYLPCPTAGVLLVGVDALGVYVEYPEEVYAVSESRAQISQTPKVYHTASLLLPWGAIGGVRLL